MDKENALIVRTLGEFSITWQGKQISGGTRDSYFSKLLQIMLHNSGTGVERGALEKMLFEDSNSLDPHHMLRSVIYNTKKRLAKADLPEADYISARKGVYYWTDEIPVEEDARKFEMMVERADRVEDIHEQAELYREACFFYKGEFLPDQSGSIWVMHEERRYRNLFFHCMERAVDYYRARGSYQEMEALGTYAAGVHPLSDWESVTMEALLGMSRFDEAAELYERTVDYYLQELGIRPTFEGMNVLDRLADQMENQYSLLEEIKEFLEEDKDAPRGGYVCSLPVFQGIYRMMDRMIDRTGHSVFLMLCTIVNSKGVPMKDGVVLTRLSERLIEAICKSVRHSDVVCRYSKNQYLILLLDTTREDCDIVKKRIDRDFKSEGQRTGISYYISNVGGKF